MADQKASILMGAAFVVFSISVGQALAGRLPWSLAILAVFAFLQRVLRGARAGPAAAHAVPRWPPDQRHAQPLFFGHFPRSRRGAVDPARCSRGLRAGEGVFRAMLHDIYQEDGQVLQRRKYRFLGCAYRLFVAGLVVTLAAFAAEFARVLA